MKFFMDLLCGYDMNVMVVKLGKKYIKEKQLRFRKGELEWFVQL